MGKGKEFARKNSQYINFDDDGVIFGTFEGMKAIIKESFGKEKEVMRYKIDGRTFDSVSVGLATQMDDVKVGDKVKITRTGEGMETRYNVEVN